MVPTIYPHRGFQPRREIVNVSAILVIALGVCLLLSHAMRLTQECLNRLRELDVRFRASLRPLLVLWLVVIIPQLEIKNTHINIHKPREIHLKNFELIETKNVIYF
jgi:hypothetical protein